MQHGLVIPRFPLKLLDCRMLIRTPCPPGILCILRENILMRLRNAISDNSSLLRENGLKRAITRFIPPGKRGDVRKERNGSETSVTLSARVAVTDSGRQCFATLLRTVVRGPGGHAPL